MAVAVDRALVQGVRAEQEHHRVVDLVQPTAVTTAVVVVVPLVMLPA